MAQPFLAVLYLFVLARKNEKAELLARPFRSLKIFSACAAYILNANVFFLINAAI